MSLGLLSIQPFWSAQSSLTALIPAANVWVGVAADRSALPYAVVVQDKADFNFTFNAGYISKTRFRISVYASTLAAVNTIVTAVVLAYQWQKVSAAGMFCRLENIVPTEEIEGAYVGSTDWTLYEAIQA